MKASTLLRCCAALSLLLGMPAVAQEKPQEKSESLAEVARRAREQKKAAPKAERVWTNDTIPQAPGTASRPAPAPGEAAEAEQPPADPALEQERAKLEAELDAERANLERAKLRLDLAQREHDLHRQQFYSNPDYANDSAGLERLRGLEAEVAAERAAVQQAEQRIAALEEQLEGLNRALGPKREEPKTEAERREAWAARIRPLREELARVEAELSRMREEAAARNMTLYGVTAGGSMTAQRLQDLENRRAELERQIAAIEDEARRAGIPPAWLR